MKTIAVLLDSDLSRSLRILAGVQEEVASVPDTRVIPMHANQTETLEHLLSMGGVDGVVGAFLGDRWLERLLPFTKPLVNVGSISEIRSIPSVTADFNAVGAFAARYFIDNGWRKTAVVYERASYASRLMHDGFVREAASGNMTPLVIPRDVICSDSTHLKSWLSLVPESSGCFCTSDFIARLVIGALRDINRPVPASVGVLGVGDSILDSVLSPVTLSSIIMPDKQIGRCAARMLADRFTNRTKAFKSESLPPIRIIVRDSSACFQYHDAIVNKAISYMASNLFSPCGTDELAHLCGASKRSLEMRFNAILGRPPAAEWRLRRHREICRLLADTRIPIQDIASLSGLSEPANFWNAFRNTEGTTPAKYRASKQST